MIFMFRTRTWVTGMAVPWAPRGAKLPPTQSVQGDAPGLFHRSKIMSILMSIFGRLGVHLGSLLGVIFGHVGAFFGPSWSRNRLRIDLLYLRKSVFLTKHYDFQRFLAQNDPKMGPRSSWVAFFFALNSRFDF